MQQASAEGLLHGLEDAAGGIDEDICNHSHAEEEQSEEEFENSIAHLAPAKQRELRDLCIPWASDK
jgi:hypothetical protein